MAKKNLRSNDTILALIGEALDVEKHSEFTCCRTPSKKEVLLCFLAIKESIKEKSNKTTKTEFEAKVSLFQKLKVENDKAGLPIQSQGGVFAKLDKMMDEFEKNAEKIS